MFFLIPLWMKKIETKLLESSLIPQAINMFDYVKEHNYEYMGCGGDPI